MTRFLAGFVTASVIWAAAGYGYLEGYFEIDLAPVEISDDESYGVATPVSEKNSRRSRRKRKYRKSSRDRRTRSGRETTSSGDHLGDNEIRDIDMAGGSGEEQLSGFEIEQGIDGVFGKIRRCLVLVADEDPVTGRIVFGLRIASSGSVTKVNLRGPRRIVSGEAGSCLKSAARSIRFRGFDGPAMIVHYPVTLD